VGRSVVLRVKNKKRDSFSLTKFNIEIPNLKNLRPVRSLFLLFTTVLPGKQHYKKVIYLPPKTGGTKDYPQEK
jgi:hypothetical protein